MCRAKGWSFMIDASASPAESTSRVGLGLLSAQCTIYAPCQKIARCLGGGRGCLRVREREARANQGLPRPTDTCVSYSDSCGRGKKWHDGGLVSDKNSRWDGGGNELRSMVRGGPFFHFSSTIRKTEHWASPRMNNAHAKNGHCHYLLRETIKK
ncbi:hypothetical protein BO99DRAFT_19803 [Aspergillus violaceofuscus CBS 115571]|uniref:Uncharacterized protein n=1 Tax=Aspergillus violaceofuscus (strain CBS 115571) TaxID=1450538 RepID=A0A2V5IR14_ASPV1|nr:hypothetical protein BO99DRAFT_19803 [Aspergillus violaceofuscus CBS 115571]